MINNANNPMTAFLNRLKVAKNMTDRKQRLQDCKTEGCKYEKFLQS